MRCRISLTVILLAFLTACAAAINTPSPVAPALSSAIPQSTAQPSETVTDPPTFEAVPPTAGSSPTPESTFTVEPTITGNQPLQPTSYLSPTQAATSMPPPVVGSGAIQFYAPGPLSKLLSPLSVYGYAIPGFNNIGTVILYGEDGSVLAAKNLQLNTAYTWAYFYGTLPFQIQAVGELARLTMSTKDQYERLTAVYSVHLVLLGEGFSIVNPPGDLRERILLEQPVPGLRIAGGILSVAGQMRPFNNLPLVLELVARDGKLIASQLVGIAPAPDDAYVPFQVNLPFSVSSGTWALLSLRQPDDRIGGTMYLYSREVFLNP
jgi:hypothetical protein